uniref:Cyclic nucleotide-binding domain-containing protein n=1 Tax=Kalanchoe fedtschenkoi TaxID=63787 RepID=A0A7N0T0A6_KALFE
MGDDSEPGDHVGREGQMGEGIYFIWDGQAEVSGTMFSEEGSSPEYQLKRYDYFGYSAAGGDACVEPANVVAITKLTCLVLPHKHRELLASKSIWSSDVGSHIEEILCLEPIDVNLFKGVTLPDSPNYGMVFGGQLIGQAIGAAAKTLDFQKRVHSLHVYFILGGDMNVPIIYQVHRLRDGKSFATRRVDAIQHGKVIFTMLASFQKDENGFDHQQVAMPSVPDPETLLSMEELRERRLTDPRLPRTYRNKVASKKFVPWPIDIRFCEPSNATGQTKTPPILRYWFRAREKLPDDQALHRCVAAYVSDLIFLRVSINPCRRPGLTPTSVSLDHSVWFHRDVRADDWILYMIFTPTAHSARGFVTGYMFDRKGELLMSLAQEGLVRTRPPGRRNIAAKI